MQGTILGGGGREGGRRRRGKEEGRREPTVKRDLLQCQKRPITVSKETYYRRRKEGGREGEPWALHTTCPHAQGMEGALPVYMYTHMKYTHSCVCVCACLSVCVCV